MASMRINRIDKAIEKVQAESPQLDDRARQSLLEALDRSRRFIEAVEIYPLPDTRFESYLDIVVVNIDNMEAPALTPFTAYEAALSCDGTLASLFSDADHMYPRHSGGMPSGLSDSWGRLAEQSSNARHLNDSRLDSEAVRSEVNASLESVRDALAEINQTQLAAQEATGKVANSSLSVEFGQYAKRQSRAAGWWTALVFTVTIMSILSVSPLASVVPFAAVLEGQAGVIFRVVSALAFLGLAAYIARLASNARRQSLWASSVEVQLRAFEAFVRPLPEEQRWLIHAEFARRVLGPVPTSRGPQTDSVQLPIGELLAFLSKQV